MELPFEYIIFKLMLNLKYREKEAKISKDNLYLIIDKLFALLPLREEELEEIREDYHFSYVISDIINNYSEYLSSDEEYIYLDIDTYSLEELLLAIEEDYPQKLINQVREVLEGNYIFTELSGIKIPTKFYNYLLDTERKIEKAYREYPFMKNNPNFIHSLNLLLLKRKMLTFYMKNNTDYDEYYDLYVYSENVAFNSREKLIINFLNSSDDLTSEDILSDPFLSAIFHTEELSLYNIHNRIAKDISLIYSSSDDDEEINSLFTKQKFYLTFLKLLEEEMESISSGQILYELKTCRYRIMNVLDSLYGTLTIFGNEYLQDNGKTLLKGDYFFSEDKEPYIFKENYTFIDKKIYFLIDELLRYEDLSYRGNSSRKLNIDTYYFNIIKKLLIKTYYYLTDDENIKDSIIHNSKYGINKISTSLLDSVIKGKKKNTRIKKNFEKNK